MLRSHIAHQGEILMLRVKVFIKTKRLVLRNTLRVGLWKECAYFIWYYSWFYLFRILKKCLGREEPRLPI
jgi:hypothetical protein